jgi:hypothetical protein
MLRPCRFVIAPNFHLAGPWPDRLLVADGGSWRAPDEVELAELVPKATREETAGCVCLFAVSGYLRSAFWSMLEDSRSREGGPFEFDAFASEVARLLTFKEMPPPAGAAYELVVPLPGGPFDARNLWAVVNLTDESVWVQTRGVRLRLGAGEGCRVPEGLAAEVLPAERDDPNVLLVVRRAS